MKRAGNLTRKISAYENLREAFYKAQKGKEDKEEVRSYASNLLKNLKKLSVQIEKGDIDVGHYHYFSIFDPKERVICAASFAERVLHHAIMNVCHAYFEKYLINDTYATRINKGTYKALDKAKKNQKRYHWYVKFDVRKYFDSIDHSVLMALLQKKFKDKNLLRLFEQIIISYHVEEGKGLPIGNLTSQYFANMYLGKLDHFIKHALKIKGYVRYMDDFIVWHNNKDELIYCREDIKWFLESELKLSLKVNALNRVENGLSFLGYRLFPHKILLSQRSKKRYRRKTAEYMNNLERGKWTQEEFAEHSRAITSFVQYAYSKKYRKQVLKKYGH